MAFRPTDDGNRFFETYYRRFKSLADESLISNSSLYIISEERINSYNVTLKKTFPGKSEGLYDKIFNGGDHRHHEYTLHLYKYVSQL